MVAMADCVRDPRLDQMDDLDIQLGDAIEVAGVGGGDSPSRGDCGGRDKPVVCADFGPGRSQASPETRMGSRNEKVEGEDRKRCKHALHKCLATRTMLARGSVHAMQQLRSCDRGDADLLIPAELHSQALSDLRARAGRRQPTRRSLEIDEDGRV
jgi:hypothetical protein